MKSRVLILLGAFAIVGCGEKEPDCPAGQKAQCGYIAWINTDCKCVKDENDQTLSWGPDVICVRGSAVSAYFKSKPRHYDSRPPGVVQLTGSNYASDVARFCVGGVAQKTALFKVEEWSSGSSVYIASGPLK